MIMSRLFLFQSRFWISILLLCILALIKTPGTSAFTPRRIHYSHQQQQQQQQHGEPTSIKRQESPRPSLPMLWMNNENDNDDEGMSVTSLVKAYSNNNSMDIIRANMFDGEFGQRGEVLMAAALFLITCVLGGGLPLWNNLFLFMGGPGLFLGGAGIILAAVNDLSSDNLTPFLSPVSQGNLVQEGIYGKVRHPMYTGLMALATGLSISTGSASRLVITAALILLLNSKAAKEEEYLLQQYPDYASYKARVTGKFIPGDWFQGDDGRYD